MTVAEFAVSGMNAWLNDIAQKYLATIRITDCIPWGSQGGQAIFEIEGSRGRASYIVRDIKEHPDITSLDMSPPEGGRLRGMVGMSNCALIRMMLSAGCFLEQAVAHGDGRVRFRVVVGTEGNISALFRMFEQNGLAVELLSLSPAEDHDSLTERQEEAVRLALQKGYFDIPRRITANELAKLSGVSAATFGDLLKRGERNLLRSYFRKK